MVWQIRWGPKCRQHTGGRIEEQKACIVKSAERHTKTSGPGKPKLSQKKTKDKVQTKKKYKSMKTQGTKKKTETHHRETLENNTGEEHRVASQERTDRDRRGLKDLEMKLFSCQDWYYSNKLHRSCDTSISKVLWLKGEFVRCVQN